jgi:sulfatase modifying factor 1
MACAGAVIAASSIACSTHRAGNGPDAQVDSTAVPSVPQSVTVTLPAPAPMPVPAQALELHVPDATLTSDDAASDASDGSDAGDTSDADHVEVGEADSGSPLCPSDMVMVGGNYCPEVRHNCLSWMDPPGPYENFRCAEYGVPTCMSEKKTALRFCIDRDEYTPPGESLPAVHHSWSTAKTTCEAAGKRLCLESEWQFACEGEEMRPYPYGFKRDAMACNIDRSNLGKPNAGLRDLRMPAGSHPRCLSPFGVRDMSGNVEEWATLDHPIDPTDKSTMKGAWWLPGRNTCRAATTGHGETYEGSQVGVRCCRDAKP